MNLAMLQYEGLSTLPLDVVKPLDDLATCLARFVVAPPKGKALAVARPCDP